MKRNSAFWLLGMGSSGSTGSVVPVAPVLTGAFGVPGAVLVTWDPTLDDGGSPLTGYPIETSLDKQSWTQVAVADPNATSSQIAAAAGTELFVRVRAQSLVGKSDPSNVLSAIPTADYNNATGGKITQITQGGKTYRVHTFLASDKFTVVKAPNPFRVLVVGGGGAGAGTPGYGSDRSGQWYSHGAGGAGGFIEQAAYVLSVGDHPVTVGGSGQDSIFGTLTAKAGGNGGFIFASAGAGGSGGGGGVGENGTIGSRQGGAGTDGQGFAGGTPIGQEGGGGGGAGGPGAGEGTVNPGGPGKVSDITGTPVTYATGGYAAGAGYGGDNTGNGGGSIGRVVAPCGAQAGGAGGTGIVVVSYEIAPFNDCEGGEVFEFEQGGKWYRTHTFKANEALKVKTAVKPFRILAVGAGFGGGIGDYAQYGGGGGGVTDLSNVTLATGDNPVTIGMPSGGSTEMKSPSGTQVIFAQGAQGGNGIPGPGGGAGGPNNGGGGDGTASDITGSSIYYAGGGGSVDWNYCCPARGGEGGRGGGGAWDCGRQNASYYGGGGGRVQHTCPNHGSGYQGVLIVRYEIEQPK